MRPQIQTRVRHSRREAGGKSSAAAPGTLAAIAILVTTAMVLPSTSGSATSTTANAPVGPTTESLGVALQVAELTQGQDIAEASPAPGDEDWVTHCDGYVRTRDTNDDGLNDEVHVDLDGDGAIDGGEPHYVGAKGVSVVPWNEKNPECLIYLDADADGDVDTLIRLYPTADGIEHQVEEFPPRQTPGENRTPDAAEDAAGGDRSPPPHADDPSQEENRRSGSGSR